KSDFTAAVAVHGPEIADSSLRGYRSSAAIAILVLDIFFYVRQLQAMQRP
ncbi:29167_t:CDS:1, partial [Racocetra persica]